MYVRVFAYGHRSEEFAELGSGEKDVLKTWFMIPSRQYRKFQAEWRWFGLLSVPLVLNPEKPLEPVLA